MPRGPRRSYRRARTIRPASAGPFAALRVLPRDALETDELFAVLQPHDAHALRVAAENRDIADRHAHECPARIDQHDLVVAANLVRAYQRAIAVARLECDDALPRA